MSVYSLSTEEKKEKLQFKKHYSEWVTWKHETVFTKLLTRTYLQVFFSIYDHQLL